MVFLDDLMSFLKLQAVQILLWAVRWTSIRISSHLISSRLFRLKCCFLSFKPFYLWYYFIKTVLKGVEQIHQVTFSGLFWCRCCVDEYYRRLCLLIWKSLLLGLNTIKIEFPRALFVKYCSMCSPAFVSCMLGSVNVGWPPLLFPHRSHL